MKRIVELDIEDAALDILQNDLGYEYVYGPDIAPDSTNPLRSRWDDVILTEKLRDAISKLNHSLTDEADVENSFLKNKRFHLQNLMIRKIRVPVEVKI